MHEAISFHLRQNVSQLTSTFVTHTIVTFPRFQQSTVLGTRLKGVRGIWGGGKRGVGTRGSHAAQAFLCAAGSGLHERGAPQSPRASRSRHAQGEEGRAPGWRGASLDGGEAPCSMAGRPGSEPHTGGWGPPGPSLSASSSRRAQLSWDMQSRLALGG